LFLQESYAIAREFLFFFENKMGNCIERWGSRYVLPAPNANGARIGPDDGEQKEGAVDLILWDGLLKKYVAPGSRLGIPSTLVDYKGISKDADFDKFGMYLSDLKLGGSPSQKDEEGPTLSHSQRCALFINAYNFFAIGHIVRHLRSTGELVASINDCARTAKTIWKEPAGVVAGVAYTLDDIEHKVLRGEFSEPRMHACIVCASMSCPDLRPEAFVATRLNAQMDDQLRQWMTNTAKGMAIDARAKKARVSKIFLWFEGDFRPSVKQFLAPFEPTQGALADAGGALDYFEYDWNINRQLDK
jgi:hypothetical protein